MSDYINIAGISYPKNLTDEFVDQAIRYASIMTMPSGQSNAERDYSLANEFLSGKFDLTDEQRQKLQTAISTPLYGWGTQGYEKGFEGYHRTDPTAPKTYGFGTQAPTGTMGQDEIWRADPNQAEWETAVRSRYYDIPPESAYKLFQPTGVQGAQAQQTAPAAPYRQLTAQEAAQMAPEQLQQHWTNAPGIGNVMGGMYYGAQGQPYRYEGPAYWQEAGGWYSGDPTTGQIQYYGPNAPWAAAAQGGAAGGIGAGLPGGSGAGIPGGAGTPPTVPPPTTAGQAGGSAAQTSLGPIPEWAAQQQQGANLQDVLASLGMESNQPGALTLAMLLGQKQPQSWMQPGAGYGDIGYGGQPTGQMTMWNEAGRPYQPGVDVLGYQYNPGNQQWSTKDLAGNVQQANLLPWQQLPWLQQTWQTPNRAEGEMPYFNAQGQPFSPGDQVAYWFNPQSNRWEQGDLSGNVQPIYGPPWMTGQQQGGMQDVLGQFAPPPPQTEATPEQVVQAQAQQAAWDQVKQWIASLPPEVLYQLQQMGITIPG